MKALRQLPWLRISGLLLSGLFLYYCFHTLSWAELRSAFAIPHPWLLAVAALGNLAVLGFKTWVWRILLKPAAELPFGFLFEAQHVGCMANVLLPLKAGEFLKAGVVKKRYGVPYTQALTSIGLERYLAGFSLVLLALGLALVFPLPAWIKTGALVMTLVLIAVQTGLFLLWQRHPDLEKWRTRHPWLYRLFQALAHIGEGSQALRSWRTFTWLVCLSMLVWISEIAMLKVLELAYGLELSWAAPVLVLVAINLAIALPSAPGNLGAFEIATVLAYTGLGLDKATALGIAVYFHFLQILPVTALGLFFYFRWGLRAKDWRAVPEAA